VLKAYLLLFLCILLGCQSHELAPKGTGHEYVPIAVGSYWEYSYTETTISPVSGQVNTISDLKLEVMDAITSGDETTYVIRRYSRPQGTTDYAPIETWSVRSNEFQWIQQEGNIPFIKLQFPLVDGKLWNANALNNLGGTETCGNGSYTCDNYAVEDLEKSFEIPGVLSYDNTVTVVENDEDDPIVSKDLRKSVYAKSIGLVYREVTHLEYCTIGNCIGQQVVENGLIIRQTLKSYGATQ